MWDFYNNDILFHIFMKYQTYLPHWYDFNAFTPIFDLEEKLEDTKSVIISPKSKKDRQCNGQMKRNKRVNHDIHNNIQNTNDLATRTKKKTGVNSSTPEGEAVPISLVLLVVLILSKTIDKACLRKLYSCDYDELNISVVI